MLRLAALLAALLTSTAATAGEWQVVDGDPYQGCQFRFTGQILPGDLTGFLEELAASPAIAPRICLNSEGGSLAEVYRFIQTEGRPYFATRVESGAVCLSSCALLFMFGETFGANSPSPSREMEPGARLGFHSPFIAPGQADQAAAEDAFRVALEVSKLLVDSSYRSLTTAGPALPPELVALVLGTPADQMAYVDRLGELGLLGIDLVARPEDGLVVPNDRAALEQVVRRICASSHVLSNRTFFVEEGYRFDDLVAAVGQVMAWETIVHALTLAPAEQYSPARITATATGPYAVPGWFSAGAVLYCQVELAVDQVPEGFAVQFYNVGFGRPVFDATGGLEGREEIDRPGIAAGLLPIETPYR